ncbi:MAG: radical SAM protein [Candidatus Ranarchaeia archaeon]|jgi:putative pyruvate formate lyase activating enzyme
MFMECLIIPLNVVKITLIKVWSMWRLFRSEITSASKNMKILQVLGRYLRVVKGRYHAKFLIANSFSGKFLRNESFQKLWSIHDDLLEQYVFYEAHIDSKQTKLEKIGKPKRSFLKLKVELARRIVQNCEFCVRNCRVNRLAGKFGWCGIGKDFQVSTIFPHMGEEPELVPSGTIFTVGCNLKCLHCQNWSISQQYEEGEVYTPEMMAKAVERLKIVGCRNLNMVGGDPTPYLHRWLDTLNLVDVNIATVWNSNSYYSEVAAKLLAGLVDVFLLDFKYGNNGCAERLSCAPRYWETCTRNHLYAQKYGELIIRVLILPGHNECCTRPILTWIAENLGTDVRLNLMDQYRPEWKANQIPELRRRLTQNDFVEAKQIAKNVGLSNAIT